MEGEKDNIEKYQDLGKEIQKIWNGIPKHFGNRLKQIGITAETAQVQKRKARILRKVLES